VRVARPHPRRPGDRRRANRDGERRARGVRAVRRAAGFVIAQDEDTAPYPEMPRAAIATAAVDLVLPLCRVAFALTALVMGSEAAIARHPAPLLVGRCLRAHRPVA